MKHNKRVKTNSRELRFFMRPFIRKLMISTVQPKPIIFKIILNLQRKWWGAPRLLKCPTSTYKTCRLPQPRRPYVVCLPNATLRIASKSIPMNVAVPLKYNC